MKHLKSFKISIILLLSLFSSAGLNQLFAQNEENQDKTLSPYFVVLSEHPESDNLPLKETSAKVNIVGVIADVTIKQTYINTGKNPLEAIYTFPLSTRAAVYAMKMSIGTRTITAKINEKEKARKDYENAKSQGKRASLLEQNRPNVFTMNVANIDVNDTIIVELKYTELLIPENGIYSFVYPTVVGPRYSNKPSENANSDDKFVETPYTKSGEEATYKFGIDIAIHSSIPVKNVTCDTHQLMISKPDMYTANAKLSPSTNAGNRDLILNYSLKGDKIESGVMLYENGNENFFLLMVQPPKQVIKEDIPPREYIFIVDVSGSMNGFPLDISKKLLRDLISNLKPDDKFNVLLFAGTSGLLSEKSLDANQENIEMAINFIEKQQGGGGTELLPALKRAYEIPRFNSNLSRSFVIATDGYVSIEKEAFDFIRVHSNNSNFFSFGIGTSVNRYLIEGMAFMGNGEPMIITKPEMAETQAEKFRNYINTPVLTNIQVDYGSFQVYDVEPSFVSDMLAERPIIIFGKYKGKPIGTITVNAKSGRKPYQQTFDLSTIKPNDNFSAIRYLWVRNRIKLLDYYSSPNEYYRNTDSTIIKEITQLGLNYNLMTQYTSFVAIDEDFKIDNAGNRVLVKQPLPLPQGVSNYAVADEDEEEKRQDVSSSYGYSSTRKVSISSADVTVNEEEPGKKTVYQIVEQMPQYPGGQEALMEYLKQNIIYPKVAMENGIQGRVIVSFVIGADGSISDIKVLRSLSPETDAEAIRVIKNMPKWIPGKQSGKAVAVSYILPITFRLNEKNSSNQ